MEIPFVSGKPFRNNGIVLIWQSCLVSWQFVTIQRNHQPWGRGKEGAAMRHFPDWLFWQSNPSQTQKTQRGPNQLCHLALHGQRKKRQAIFSNYLCVFVISFLATLKVALIFRLSLESIVVTRPPRGIATCVNQGRNNKQTCTYCTTCAWRPREFFSADVNVIGWGDLTTSTV